MSLVGIAPTSSTDQKLNKLKVNEVFNPPEKIPQGKMPPQNLERGVHLVTKEICLLGEEALKP